MRHVHLAVMAALLGASAVEAVSARKNIDLEKLKEQYLDEDDEEEELWADKPKKKPPPDDNTPLAMSDLEQMLTKGKGKDDPGLNPEVFTLFEKRTWVGVGPCAEQRGLQPSA